MLLNPSLSGSPHSLPTLLPHSVSPPNPSLASHHPGAVCWGLPPPLAAKPRLLPSPIGTPGPTRCPPEAQPSPLPHSPPGFPLACSLLGAWSRLRLNVLGLSLNFPQAGAEQGSRSPHPLLEAACDNPPLVFLTRSPNTEERGMVNTWWGLGTGRGVLAETGRKGKGLALVGLEGEHHWGNNIGTSLGKQNGSPSLSEEVSGLSVCSAPQHRAS